VDPARAPVRCPGRADRSTTREVPRAFTGIHVSDGDPTAAGLLGAEVPDLSDPSWRTFWTRQHGGNVTREVHWGSAR
jgi:hypothetical protein